jgi:PAS domain S-box-containing protein
MTHKISEQSKELFHLVVENVEDFAVYAKDLKGHVLSWNLGVERLLGYEEEEWVGQHISIIFTPEDRAQGAVEQELRTALVTGRAEDQRWHVRKDGTHFWANGLLMLLRDERGEPRAFAKILRNDTKHKQADDELRRAHDGLERRVEERTAELRGTGEALLAEVEERRTAERHIKGLLHRIVNAQEIERRRIAQDLHDNLGQQMTALRLNLELLKERCETEAELCELVGRAQHIAENIEREVDFIAWELRPAALDQLGLVQALGSFTAEWSKHYGTAAEFHSAGLDGDRLAPEVETNLYRITQEALNNIMKHAGASRVNVLLERLDGRVTLIVEDDGAGFEPGQSADGGRGMGLLSMRERAAQVGGTLEIESTPGAGTTLYVKVPAEHADAKDEAAGM